MWFCKQGFIKTHRNPAVTLIFLVTLFKALIFFPFLAIDWFLKWLKLLLWLNGWRSNSLHSNIFAVFSPSKCCSFLARQSDQVSNKRQPSVTIGGGASGHAQLCDGKLIRSFPGCQKNLSAPLPFSLSADTVLYSPEAQELRRSIVPSGTVWSQNDSEFSLLWSASATTKRCKASEAVILLKSHPDWPQCEMDKGTKCRMLKQLLEVNCSCDLVRCTCLPV